MNKRIFSSILVAITALAFTVSSSFAITYDQPTKDSTTPIMYLNADDEDAYDE